MLGQDTSWQERMKLGPWSDYKETGDVSCVKHC